VSVEPASSPAEDWVAAFQDAVRRFVEARSISGCTVRVTLADDRQVFVKDMQAGPGPVHVTLDVYPDDNDEILLEAEGLFTPSAVIVQLDRLIVVELLHEPPEDRPVGFGAQSGEEQATA
jgi:hypothetical protein